MNKRTVTSAVLAVVGVLLVLSAVYLYISGVVMENNGKKLREELLLELKNVTPTAVDAVYDDRGNTDMSCIQINGYDIAGILSEPSYNRELPVGFSWDSDESAYFPHRFFGSIYDGSLIIGGSQSSGSFDFMNSISVSDSVLFTDVDGNRYSFKVTDIVRKKNVSNELFESMDADLILYAKGIYSFDYTVVLCDCK